MSSIVVFLLLFCCAVAAPTPALEHQEQDPEKEAEEEPWEPPDPADIMEYFVGTWSFEWTAPDSPFGPGGKISGTETYAKTLGGHFLESVIEGSGPDGAFEGRALMGYDETEEVFKRFEAHSNGAAILKTGPLAGDAGGWNHINWESAPFTVNGAAVRLKGATHMYSPNAYRVRMQISVDGGEFTNLGSPWFRRQVQE